VELPLSSPLVSVVIPTYNAAALLVETLETVFAQTFDDFEVVVVNDGSPDDTSERARGMGDRRLRLIEQPNAGVGAARNRGIDEARGQYIALLDHDDLWHPDKLRLQVEHIRAYPDRIAVTVPFAYSTCPERPPFDPAMLATADGLIRRPLEKLAMGVSFMVTSSTLMFHRERAVGLRYGERRGAIEDVQFFIKLFVRGPIGLAGAMPLVTYRVHASNASRESTYYYNGIMELRRLRRNGYFDDLPATQRPALDAFLGHLGRNAVAAQLLGKQRRRAAGLFGMELAHQVRLKRWRFLASFPLLMLCPQSLVNWAFGRKEIA
jgi:glycosyltransferase involved in cell wall biosynthesis